MDKEHEEGRLVGVYPAIEALGMDMEDVVFTVWCSEEGHEFRGWNAKDWGERLDRVAVGPGVVRKWWRGLVCGASVGIRADVEKFVLQDLEPMSSTTFELASEVCHGA